MSEASYTKEVMKKFKPFNAKKVPDNLRPQLRKMAKRGKQPKSFGNDSR